MIGHNGLGRKSTRVHPASGDSRKAFTIWGLSTNVQITTKASSTHFNMAVIFLNFLAFIHVLKIFMLLDCIL